MDREFFEIGSIVFGWISFFLGYSVANYCKDFSYIPRRPIFFIVSEVFSICGTALSILGVACLIPWMFPVSVAFYIIAASLIPTNGRHDFDSRDVSARLFVVHLILICGLFVTAQPSRLVASSWTSFFFAISLFSLHFSWLSPSAPESPRVILDLLD